MFRINEFSWLAGEDKSSVKAPQVLDRFKKQRWFRTKNWIKMVDVFFCFFLVGNQRLLILFNVVLSVGELSVVICIAAMAEIPELQHYAGSTPTRHTLLHRHHES